MEASRIQKSAEQKRALSVQRERLLKRSATIAIDRNIALTQRVGAGAFSGRPQVDETDNQIARQIAELDRTMQTLGIKQVAPKSAPTVEQIQQQAEQDPMMPPTMHINPAHHRHMLKKQHRQQ